MKEKLKKLKKKYKVTEEDGSILVTLKKEQKEFKLQIEWEILQMLYPFTNYKMQ